METTGNNKKRIENALSNAGKREALAAQVGVNPGQLSKLINGELNRFCLILESLRLEIYPQGYVESLERILREKL